MVYGVPLDRFTIHGLALGLALALWCILLGVGGPVGGRPPEGRRPGGLESGRSPGGPKSGRRPEAAGLRFCPTMLSSFYLEPYLHVPILYLGKAASCRIDKKNAQMCTGSLITIACISLSRYSGNKR